MSRCDVEERRIIYRTTGRLLAPVLADFKFFPFHIGALVSPSIISYLLFQISVAGLELPGSS